MNLYGVNNVKGEERRGLLASRAGVYKEFPDLDIDSKQSVSLELTPRRRAAKLKRETGGSIPLPDEAQTGYDSYQYTRE